MLALVNAGEDAAMLRPSALVIALLVAGVLVGEARAQPATPVVIAGETWQRVAIQAGNRFTRADGTTVDFGVSKDDCTKQLRTAEAARPPWVPMVYWPKVDTAGGKLGLCLELAQATVLAVVTPAAGKTADAGVAPLLDEVASAARPPTEVPGLGTVQPSRPIVLAAGTALAFVIDGQPASVGVSHADHGTCSYENALVLGTLGELADRTFADGYSPTVASNGKGALYVCLELREGYLAIVVSPEAQLAGLTDVLADVRRAAYLSHGAPISTASGSATLPHTGQQVSTAGNRGEWKVVDGEPFKQPGADVLVSTAGVGHDSTMFAVAVSEGPCAPGTAVLEPGLAALLVPAVLGPVWFDDSEYKLRWRAWACVTKDGATATITVLAPIAQGQAPNAQDQLVLWPLIASLVRSYGVELPAPGGGGYHREHGKVAAMVGTYLGFMSLAPEDGERRKAFLVGLDLRVVQRKGLGGVFAFDTELGYGGGEFIGEIRAGGGLALGPLELVVGGAVGSIGPAAALDGYAQVGTTFDLAHGKLYLGGLHAVGVHGADHTQVDGRLVVTGQKDSGLFFGARAGWFGDTTDDNGVVVGNGSAVLFTFGTGLASED